MSALGFKGGLAGMVLLAVAAFGARGFEKAVPPVGTRVSALQFSRTHEFAVVDHRIWKRPMGSTRWERNEHEPQPGWGMSVHAFGDTVVIVQGSKASVSLDHGGSWIPMGMPAGEIKFAHAGPGGLVCTEYVGVGTQHHNVHFSKDLGAAWRNPILIPVEPVSAVVWKGGIYLSLFDHGVLRIDLSNGQPVPFQAGLPDSFPVDLSTDGKNLLAQASGMNRVYLYSESAARWEPVLEGPLDGPWVPVRFHGDKAFLWAFNENGVLLHHSADGGANWSGLPLAGFANILAILPRGEGYLATTMDGGIFRLDGLFRILGRQDEGFAPLVFNDLHAAGSRVYASGSSYGGHFQSDDLGKTWTLLGRRNSEGAPYGKRLVSLGGATYLEENDSLVNISEAGLGMPSLGIISHWRSWFVDAGSRIYMQGDDFTSRSPIKSSQSVMPSGPFQGIYKAVRIGGKWMVSTPGGLYHADIGAKTWLPFVAFDIGTEIAAISGNRMVVYGGPGKAHYTQDAGATWSTLALPFQPTGPLAFAWSDKVACVAPQYETGSLLVETWCSEVADLPLPIRASPWKRLAALKP